MYAENRGELADARVLAGGSSLVALRAAVLLRAQGFRGREGLQALVKRRYGDLEVFGGCGFLLLLDLLLEIKADT